MNILEWFADRYIVYDFKRGMIDGFIVGLAIGILLGIEF